MFCGAFKRYAHESVIILGTDSRKKFLKLCVEDTPASKAVSHRDQSDELIQESFTDATESTAEERPSAAPGPMASQARTETKAQPRVETVALPILQQPSSHGDSGHAPKRLVRPREPFPST